MLVRTRFTAMGGWLSLKDSYFQLNQRRKFMDYNRKAEFKYVVDFEFALQPASGSRVNLDLEVLASDARGEMIVA